MGFKEGGTNADLWQTRIQLQDSGLMVRVSGLRLEVEVRGLRLQEVLLFLVAGVLRAIQLIHIYIHMMCIHIYT